MPKILYGLNIELATVKLIIIEYKNGFNDQSSVMIWQLYRINNIQMATNP